MLSVVLTRAGRNKKTTRDLPSSPGPFAPRPSSNLKPPYLPGSKVNFCTRQFNNSAANRTFSDGHASS